ncbi:hypothetical protein SAY86_027918 [Trapa natans]|uniref:Phospholipase n=1 Tax=Trapa natans TaxID=22666 RepID=A0AAN7MBY8_TRANT|nr:hypothetical protein SAY86_027918 [Trapa natans]
MSTERLISNGAAETQSVPRFGSHRHCAVEGDWIFDELPRAIILSVSRPETADFSPMLLSYTIEVRYKQFKWSLFKKASQVLYLHFALKKRAFMEEFNEMQEQVKEWLHSLGVVDQTAVVPDDDEPDDGALPLSHSERTKNRYVPSRAALPIIRPSLGRHQTVSDRAKIVMHNYLNYFLGNLDIVNSREVCEFLEVSRLSFSSEYGPKLKEGYVLVNHLRKLSKVKEDVGCFPCLWFAFWNNHWQKVWAVLKPGFLAFLGDPFDPEPLDIVVFNILPSSGGIEISQSCLADQIKEPNPLYYSFKVSCGSRWINFRATSSGKVESWVSAINNAAQKPPEGWCNPNRFGSYAPPRGLTEDGSQAQWYIDGEAAFEAISSAIEEAKAEIFMTGWWLCPELYLRRPFQNQSSSRLDALLEAKAKQGVQIYILLYKEVALALKINSFYSKKKLLEIHENIRVLRYPDHLSTGIYLWSHHEKLVIVDHRVCFLGGLDLCFGRYDTNEHKVSDFPPILWPGKDYYNPRESEPNSWEETATDEIDREKYPRMPWHDVHCALWGPPCRDVARHFVLRWNHAKRNKAQYEQTIPLLIPRHHMVIPHYLGRTSEVDIKSERNSADNQKKINRQNSFSSPSQIQAIPLLLPQEAELPNSALNTYGNIDDQREDLETSIQYTMKAKDDHLEMSGESDEDDILGGGFKQVGFRTSCCCQVVRSASQWSVGTSQTEDSIHKAYCLLIERAEHFIYIENQFFISGLSGDEVIQNRVLDALYKRIVRAHREQRAFRVVVVIPLLPGFQGGLDDAGAATVRAVIHWQYRTISREKTSILHYLKILLGDKVHDYISFYGLRSHGRLSEGGPVASSQVYVHSKVMIIDDRAAFVGSSNINDRSLLGSRDSEIGVIIEDKEFVASSMNGRPWRAGKFSHSLRCHLWAEHLGLNPGEICQIKDPVTDATYKDLWLSRAKSNTEIYDDVFACIPNDNIRSRTALRQNVAGWKEKIGHTTIDLGIAPEKLELEDQGGGIIAMDPMERLRGVKGHLVNFPLEFMSEEADLRPLFNETEFYAGPLVFH